MANLSSLAQKEILVINENAFFLETISKFLTSKQGRVFSYQDYDQAFVFIEEYAKLPEQKIDYIVCDYIRSNITAYNFFEQLQLQNGGPELLLLTMLQDSPSHPQSIEQTGNYHIRDLCRNLYHALEECFNEMNGITVIQNPLRLRYVQELILLEPNHDATKLRPSSAQLLGFLGPNNNNNNDVPAPSLLIASDKNYKNIEKINTIVIEYQQSDMNRQRPLHGRFTEQRIGLFDDQILNFSLNEEDWQIWKDLVSITLK